jgi:SAM-dependent methyltransferase
MYKMNETTSLNVTKHPLEFINHFSTVQEYCLHLLHLHAYEEVASLTTDKTVLDLGCNNGFGTAYLSERAAKAVGLDITPKAIADAKQRFAQSKAEYMLYDGKLLPFPDGHFDIVVSFQVIEHVEDVPLYLSEIVRVLRPRGKAVFTTPNAAIRLDPGMKPWNPFHFREYLPRELKETLQGYFDVEIHGHFAKEKTYLVEYQRSQGLRNTARRQREGSAPSMVHWIKTGFRSIRGVLRPIYHAVRPKTLSPEIMKQYSSRDFFYRDKELESALDLMALCERR